jgi:purine-nucleoside/S-methyl-5'-thioadenosine phosphorylase / adenosine deaminase
MSPSTTILPEVSAPFAWREDGELAWLEAKVGSATAVFSTRLGGVSDGAYRSLNLGVLTDDDHDHVLGNRRALATALGRDSDSIVMGHQVHGTEVQLRRRAPEPGESLREADGQVTVDPDLTPLVLVADCLPLVLFAPGAVAAVHCGWRGVAGGIVEQAVAIVRERSPEGMSAVLGPGIGPCCYEVGDEVRTAFRDRGLGDGVIVESRVDLARAIRRELEELGVAAGRIHACDLCTSCNPELFFSHRRDGSTTGRQAGLAWLSL